jgi:hypothetical protein
MATMVKDEVLFGSKKHLESFRKALPFDVVPTNVEGAYATTDMPKAHDLAAPSKTTLLKQGIVFRKPGANDRPGVVKAWDRAFGPKGLTEKTIVPILQPQMGKTHHLRKPAEKGNTAFTGTQWAGSVVKGTWVSATGNWTVPTVSQPTEAQGTSGGWDSSSWVGIDGFNGTGFTGSNDVLQAGVQQFVNARGAASYVAWFEWFVPTAAQGTITGISNGKVVLGDTTPMAPALTSLNGHIYLAWRGDGNDQMNIEVSFDNGATFHNKLITGDTTTDSPAICAHNGNLFIAWKGDGNDNLNVAQVGLNVDGVPTGFVNKVILGDTSPTSPSLASNNGTLYLAWKGDSNDNLNVMSSTDEGRTFGNKMTSPETSDTAPALVANNGQLFIGWKGSGNDNLNVAVVDTDVSTGNATGISRKTTLGDTSPERPSLVGMNGYLFLSWKGDGNDNLNVMVSLDNGVTFGGKMTSGETSPFATALTANNGQVFISWKGDGNDQLNVAPVSVVGFAEPAYQNQTNIANFPVNPGDQVTCAVSYLAKTAGVINFSNQTTGQRFTVTLAPPATATFSGETVEWIMEAPNGGLPTTSLPKFTAVTFTSAFGCNSGDTVVANPQTSSTVNIVSTTKTLTSVTTGDDTVTISFTG